MIRSVSTFIQIGLIPATLSCLGTVASHAADTPKSQSYSMVPTSPSDHFIAGKYDKTGTYIPPHYQAAAKPPFHGYFFKKHTPGYDGLNSGSTDKTHLDNDTGDQAGEGKPY